MTRKEFLFRFGIVVITTSITKDGIAEEKNTLDTKIRLTSLEEAKKELQKWENAKVESSTDWDFSQILNHAAQSIEYSMKGYPELRSPFFRYTVGKIAISVFLSRGFMSHGLNDPIPGAPELEKNTSLEQAFQRIYRAIDTFQKFEGELKPHLAYDTLAKEDYDKAHAMHIANHLSSLTKS